MRPSCFHSEIRLPAKDKVVKPANNNKQQQSQQSQQQQQSHRAAAESAAAAFRGTCKTWTPAAGAFAASPLLQIHANVPAAAAATIAATATAAATAAPAAALSVF
ncbi:hypothetical protein ACSSS7_004440 [Eimeria intestinalis]